MTDSTNSTDSNKNSTPDLKDTPAAPPADNTNSNLDEFGYEKTTPKTDDKAPVQTEPKTSEPAAEDDVPTGYDDKDASTGYDKDTTPKTDDKAPVENDKTKEPSPEEAAKKELEEVLKDAPKNVSKDKILEFATKHKMTKEQVADYVGLMKEDNERAIKEREAQLSETRKGWKEELYNDPNFGAASNETFDKSVFEARKVLNKFMPNMKKVLTERGTMLPPYVMKDLLGLSKVLNPKTDFTQGDPSKVEPKEKNFLEEMYQ